MSVREYIGARYIPLFSDPIQWDSTLSYEPLTVVTNQGTSYVSKQSVPEGIDILNETYWLRWADYNAQLEEYIRQVQAYSGRISALNDALPIADFDANDTVKDAIDAVNTDINAIKADSWVTANRIANNAITTDKVATNAITSAKIADNAITSEKIANKTIVAADIADHTITAQQLQNPFIIVLGDSWSDENVAASRWVPTLRSMYPNATVKNYAKNGCHHSNGSFENMYNAFITDTTIDKSKITHVVLLYGVNDQYTYPIADTGDEASVIKNFYNAVIAQIPNDVHIQWVINHSYGIRSNPWDSQYEYWLRVIQSIGASCPRMTPHESMSWFNWSEYNSDNWFHLTEGAQRNHLAKNMRTVIFGDGALVKYPTVTTLLQEDTQSTGYIVRMDITGSSLVFECQWNAKHEVINQLNKPLSAPLPQSFDVFDAIPVGSTSWTVNAFCHFKTEQLGDYINHMAVTIGNTGDNIPVNSQIRKTFHFQGF